MPYARSSDTDLEILEPEPGEVFQRAPPPTSAEAPRRSPKVLAVLLAIAVGAAAIATGLAFHFRSELSDVRRRTTPTTRPSPQSAQVWTPLGTQSFAPDVAAMRGHGSLAVARFDGLHLLDGSQSPILDLPQRYGLPARPAWSPSGGWLSFMVAPNQSWVSRADGTDTRQIGLASATAWSPINDTVALASDTGVRLVSVDGRPARTLPGTKGASSLAWSPDGRSLAFASPLTAGNGLSVVAASGGEPQSVSNEDAGAVVVGWWPDGRGLLFWRYRGAPGHSGVDLMSVRLDGSSPKRLTTMLPHRSWISWSPDGHRLAVVEGSDERAYTDKRLVVCDAQTATCRTVARRKGTVAVDPAWSPDGSQILYVQAVDAEAIPYDDWVAGRQLWTVRPDGSSNHSLDVELNAPGAPSWSRDGKSIVVVGMNGIWLVDENRRVVPVVGDLYGRSFPPGYDDGFVDWSNIVAWRPA